MKIRDAVEGFTCEKILTKFSQTRFSTGYGGKDMFYSFIKLSFSLLTKRKTIYETRIVNSHNSKTVNHIAHAIFVFHSAMKTRTIQIIL